MSADALPEHPAPHRHKAGAPLLLAVLACAPGAWIIQLVGAYGLTSYICAPAGAPDLAAPAGWPPMRIALMVLNLSCLALAAAGGLFAAWAWRRTQGEKPGSAQTLLQVGEGRTRFLAACGMMSAVGFGLAILFNSAEYSTVPACWGSAP